MRKEARLNVIVILVRNKRKSKGQSRQKSPKKVRQKRFNVPNVKKWLRSWMRTAEFVKIVPKNMSNIKYVVLGRNTIKLL